MKKIAKILSVALAAMLVLSLSASALADGFTVRVAQGCNPTTSVSFDGTVKIPAKLGKLNLRYNDISEIKYPKLTVRMDPVYYSYEDENDTNPCPILAGEDSDYLLFFSESVDWVGASVSSLDGGWIVPEFDEDCGAYVIEGPLVRQPGMWSASGKCVWNPDLGRCIPEWYACGGDYPYYAGKTYEDYTVSVSYRRNGKAYKVAVTYPDDNDVFKTGIKGGDVTITFECVNVELDTVKKNGKLASTDVWYISRVSTHYPETDENGNKNHIVGIEADYRNDTKQNLVSYRISWLEDDGVYKITYAPKTTTIDEKTWTPICPGTPSGAKGDPYIHHYTADEPIYGEHYSTYADWNDGKVHAVSGSGADLRYPERQWKLNKWFAPGHGKQVKGIKYWVTYFTSPRVK